MSVITINPSIAQEFRFLPIGKDERRPILFRNKENWPGTYLARVWDSKVKNIEYTVPNTDFTVVDKDMTYWLDATEQQIPVGSGYLEIYSNQEKAVIIKANFEVLK